METVSDNETAAEWVAIGELHPWDKNPRRNDGEPVKRVADSIKRFGFGAPILARRNGEIIAGHTRWKAAKKLGLDRVPVRYLDLDPAEAKLLALADNRLGELAEWDDLALAKLLGECVPEDQLAAGWNEGELRKLLEHAGDEVMAGDDSDKVATSYAVVIECEDEDHQLQVIAACEEQGWSCRALT